MVCVEVMEVASLLLRQADLAVDAEVSGDGRGSSTGLAATDAERVIPGGDDGVTGLSDHAEIAIVELEVYLLALAGFQMDALESA